MARGGVRENVGEEGKEDREGESERRRGREKEARLAAAPRRAGRRTLGRNGLKGTSVGRLIALIFTRLANGEERSIRST